MNEEDIGQVTQFLHEGILLTQQAKSDHEASLKTADPPAKPTTKVVKNLDTLETWKVSFIQRCPLMY